MTTKPTEKEEFEKSLLAKCQLMIEEETGKQIGKLREDLTIRFNAIEGALTGIKQVINDGHHKELTLSEKILAFLESNLNKPVTLTDIITNTTDSGNGKAVDEEALRLVSAELTKLQDSGEYGVGNFGNNIWMMVSKKDGNIDTPPSGKVAS